MVQSYGLLMLISCHLVFLYPFIFALHFQFGVNYCDSNTLNQTDDSTWRAMVTRDCFLNVGMVANRDNQTKESGWQWSTCDCLGQQNNCDISPSSSYLTLIRNLQQKGCTYWLQIKYCNIWLMAGNKLKTLLEVLMYILASKPANWTGRDLRRFMSWL